MLCWSLLSIFCPCSFFSQFWLKGKKYFYCSAGNWNTFRNWNGIWDEYFVIWSFCTNWSVKWKQSDYSSMPSHAPSSNKSSINYLIVHTYSSCCNFSTFSFQCCSLSLQLLFAWNNSLHSLPYMYIRSIFFIVFVTVSITNLVLCAIFSSLIVNI